MSPSGLTRQSCGAILFSKAWREDGDEYNNSGRPDDDRALAKAGHTDSDIAERSGWSVSTVRKWRRREAKQGLQGLASKVGRPATGAMSTFASDIFSNLNVRMKLGNSLAHQETYGT